MEEQKCAECAMRSKYDTNPKSFIGRFWRWHINFCPGWKGYMSALPEEERFNLAQKYNLKKYLN